MKILVISDTHSNFFATEAVFQSAKQIGFDIFVHLGDIVGYGAMPNETCELVQQMQSKFDGVVLAGNHDAVVKFKNPYLFKSEYNKNAFNAMVWTKKHLTALNMMWLQSLPLKADSPIDGLSYVHGSPFEATNEYVFTGYKAAQNMKIMAGHNQQIVFNGHTHKQVVFECTPPILKKNNALSYVPSKQHAVTFKKNGYYLCNPGSVGQPRQKDMGGKACFAIFDTQSRMWSFHNTPYDTDAMITAHQATDLPKELYTRVLQGE